MDCLPVERAQSPKLSDTVSQNPAAPEVDQLLEDRHGSIAGQIREFRIAGGNIDRGPCQDQFSDLGGKARGIGQRHPAALTQANEVHCTAEFVHQHVKVGDIVVDRQQAHVRAR